MEIILVDLEKVKKGGRWDYDFYNPNQKKIVELLAEDYTKDKLKNVCLKINTGKTAPRNAYPEEGIRIIKVKNITGNGINWEPEFFITPEFYEKAKKKAQVQVGDILMLCSAHNKSYIGRCDIIDFFPQSIINDTSRCCCVGELIIIRANPQKISPDYLITFLRLPIVQEQIRLMVKGQSAHLYPRDLINLDVILPSKEIQEEIAKLNRDAQKEFLKKMKEAKENLIKTREQIKDVILNGKNKK
jgi:restriction endonuclease S subunit